MTALGLNVRSSPHAGSRDNITGRLRRGDRIEISGRDGAWLEITYNGQPAFVHGGYVEREAATRTSPTEDLSQAPQTSAVQRRAIAATTDTSQGVHAAADRE